MGAYGRQHTADVERSVPVAPPPPPSTAAKRAAAAAKVGYADAAGGFGRAVAKPAPVHAVPGGSPSKTSAAALRASLDPLNPEDATLLETLATREALRNARGAGFALTSTTRPCWESTRRRPSASSSQASRRGRRRGVARGGVPLSEGDIPDHLLEQNAEVQSQSKLLSAQLPGLAEADKRATPDWWNFSPRLSSTWPRDAGIRRSAGAPWAAWAAGDGAAAARRRRRRLRRGYGWYGGGRARSSLPVSSTASWRCPSRARLCALASRTAARPRGRSRSSSRSGPPAGAPAALQGCEDVQTIFALRRSRGARRANLRRRRRRRGHVHDPALPGLHRRAVAALYRGDGGKIEGVLPLDAPPCSSGTRARAARGWRRPRRESQPARRRRASRSSPGRPCRCTSSSPPRSPSRSPPCRIRASGEDERVLRHAKVWEKECRAVSRHTKQRPYRAVATDGMGRSVHLCRYIASAQLPPGFQGAIADEPTLRQLMRFCHLVPHVTDMSAFPSPRRGHLDHEPGIFGHVRGGLGGARRCSSAGFSSRSAWRRTWSSASAPLTRTPRWSSPRVDREKGPGTRLRTRPCSRIRSSGTRWRGPSSASTTARAARVWGNRRGVQLGQRVGQRPGARAAARDELEPERRAWVEAVFQRGFFPSQGHAHGADGHHVRELPPRVLRTPRRGGREGGDGCHRQEARETAHAVQPQGCRARSRTYSATWRARSSSRPTTRAAV